MAACAARAPLSLLLGKSGRQPLFAAPPCRARSAVDATNTNTDPATKLRLLLQNPPLSPWPATETVLPRDAHEKEIHSALHKRPSKQRPIARHTPPKRARTQPVPPSSASSTGADPEMPGDSPCPSFLDVLDEGESNEMELLGLLRNCENRPFVAPTSPMLLPDSVISRIPFVEEISNGRVFSLNHEDASIRLSLPKEFDAILASVHMTPHENSATTESLFTNMDWENMMGVGHLDASMVTPFPLRPIDYAAEKPGDLLKAIIEMECIQPLPGRSSLLVYPRDFTNTEELSRIIENISFDPPEESSRRTPQIAYLDKKRFFARNVSADSTRRAKFCSPYQTSRVTRLLGPFTEGVLNMCFFRYMDMNSLPMHR